MSEYVCPYCKGKGIMTEENIDGELHIKCGRCNGTGYVDELRSVEK